MDTSLGRSHSTRKLSDKSRSLPDIGQLDFNLTDGLSAGLGEIHTGMTVQGNLPLFTFPWRTPQA